MRGKEEEIKQVEEKFFGEDICSTRRFLGFAG
jgi:hypothetical protein